ncbi:hypothetical protein ACH46N_24525 [Streptomyces pristinaespiralis]|uniref:Uncharacterized protein n=1 Tax=Streptomyces pristinaespiralis TaxID=38300 RepID=A0A0M4DHB6_STRPR|nr:hypothetical protein [Streptomyces pristinaespiralis]ALC22535.1 hypothetical protein SPRI_4229 [Streptomyces pristinaespiralis]QMU14876.1 hypothetical protein H3L99_15750 [Streptomyces pristinaespiralis]
MTHSGQGDEQRLPAARPAHEGVVLPADGSEPLIPGAAGAQTTPAGGQPWGEPWGPQQSAPAPAPGAAYGYPGPPPGGDASQGYGYPAPAQPAGYGYPAAPPQPGGYGYPGGPAQGAPQGYPGAPAQQGGYGAPAQQGGYGTPGTAPQQTNAHHGPGAHAAPPAGPAPTGHDPYAAQGGHPGQAPYGAQVPAVPQPGVHRQPLPPQDAPAQSSAPQGPDAYGAYPEAPRGAGQAGFGGPGAPAAQAGFGAPAPQPYQAPQGPGPQAPAPHDPYGQGSSPQAAGPDAPGGFPQAAPAHAAGGDSDATQYIAPVAPGALPPEMPAESTTFLGTGPLASGAAQGGTAQGAGQVSDSDATQYIAPVPGGAAPPAPAGAPFGIRPGAPGDRQPPAEFDSLFRSEGQAPETADATQQMPRFEQPPGHGHPQARRPAPRHEPYHDPEPEPRRRSLAPVVAALVVGCAVLGLGVGAVMFSGGDEPKDPGPDKNVAADAPAPSEASPTTQAADPAEPQAKELDKLLADSNNSRDAVIRSVENIKVCKNLDQATADLKGAAQQRRSLVTRLGTLSVDKLPRNAELTASLTKAWQASASADDHYAAWAQQVKGKKGCKDGKARVTSRTAQGNAASGEATKAKNEASTLWNSIARTYGLTERRSSQL